MNSLWPAAEDLRADLSPHQRDAWAAISASPLCLLTGTPGTGKTFVAAAAVGALIDRFGREAVAVAAPTGKAAVRIRESMARLGVRVQSETIHQLLEIGRNGHDGDGWDFQRNAANPLDQRFVVIDETSMLDCDLAASLTAALACGSHLLLVGDPYQLPPVGHGAPLRDLIAAGAPCHELTEIRRNAGLIVRACAAIKDGRDWEVGDRYDADAGLNLRHFECATPEAQQRSLEEILTRFGQSGRFDPVWDVQVLCATNRTRGEVNKALQSLFNSFSWSEKYKHPFRPGDKIICLRNHWATGEEDRRQTYYVANGEVGKVKGAEEKLIVADFAGRPAIRVPIGKQRERDDDASEGGAGCDFDLGYCITGHKAQGSEWPCVIALVDPSPGARFVCSREWWYTTLSRASKLCITVGRFGVLQQQAKRKTLAKRKTFLTELIKEGLCT